MSQNTERPSTYVAKLKAHRNSLDKRIAEADSKHVYALSACSSGKQALKT